jgi:serine/threonine protein phosphatase PrpC
MSQFAIEQSHTIAIDFAVEQMSSGQDYVCAGKGVDSQTGEPFDYIMLNDGHGENYCINFIRSMTPDEKAECIGSTDPIRALVAKIDGSGCVPWNKSSGATAVILKCYSNRAEVIACGDSQAVVFKDGEIIHITEEHNSSNKLEHERVTQDSQKYFTPSTNISLFSDSELVAKPTQYVNFPNGSQLACTQALGHNSKTGYDPSTFIFHYDDDSSYRVVLGSDGVFDMMMIDSESDIQVLRTKTSQEICDWIVARWLQEWKYKKESGEYQTFRYSRKDSDDVSVAVADIIRNQPTV